jgi:hypothetical protein
MSVYPFKIDDIPFYASEEPNWQPYGVQDAYSPFGRPIPGGTGSFTVTVRAIPYDDTYLSGTGDPWESTGTFKQLFGLWQTAIATRGGVQTFAVFDPWTNEFVEVEGILNIAKLLENLTGGTVNSDVTIEVNAAFISAEDRSSYNGGDPGPIVQPPYIPGDPLPPPDPTLTYGWGIGRWGYGYWGRGEGEVA